VNHRGRRCRNVAKANCRLGGGRSCLAITQRETLKVWGEIHASMSKCPRPLDPCPETQVHAVPTDTESLILRLAVMEPRSVAALSRNVGCNMLAWEPTSALHPSPNPRCRFTTLRSIPGISTSDLFMSSSARNAVGTAFNPARIGLERGCTSTGRPSRTRPLAHSTVRPSVRGLDKQNGTQK
jgi:hypothetical protein